MLTNALSQLRRGHLPVILIVGFALVILMACGQALSEQPEFTFDPQKGQLEKTVSDHTLVLGWEGDGSCIITILEKGSDTGDLTMIFEACTVDNVVEVIEGWKRDLPSSAPAWQRDVLDQLIAELRQSE